MEFLALDLNITSEYDRRIIENNEKIFKLIRDNWSLVDPN